MTPDLYNPSVIEVIKARPPRTGILGPSAWGSPETSRRGARIRHGHTP